MKNLNILVQVISVVVLLVLTTCLYFYQKQTSPTSLVINEVAFSNEDGVDWIEIYNPTMSNLSLEGLYLSDKSKDLSKFEVKDTYIVPAGGFVVIYCEDAEQIAENSISTNFRISKGETVYLIDKDGSSIVDSMTVVENSDADNVTIGRFPDGDDEIFLMDESTPGDSNIKNSML